MNTDRLVRIGLVVVVVAIGGYIYQSVQESNERDAAALAAQQEMDSKIVARLERILDITVAAIIDTEAKAKSAASKMEEAELAEASFGLFLNTLETKYNAASWLPTRNPT